MNETKQRIAIAEACGWIWSTDDKYFNILKAPDGSERCCGKHLSKEEGFDAYFGHLPDYLNDLNAMHEAEKALNKDKRESYIRILHMRITEAKFRSAYEADWAIMTATATQRAEAFLRTLGKWEES